MSDDLVLVSQEGAVATVTMNEPNRRNACSTPLRALLIERMSALMEDGGCRAIVLTGAGGTFCSGGDIQEMKESTPEGGRARLEASHKLIRLIVNGPTPVIAAVEGHAAGAGMSLAVACDYVVAAADAKFTPSFARVGLIADGGLFWTLTQRVGLGKAKALMALADTVEGQEAVQIGLAETAAAPGDALKTAQDIAARFAEGPPRATALLKLALAGRSTTLEDAFRAEMDFQCALFETEDHKAAVEAFFAKRPPVFTGA